jgi:myo-inositol 2-dehydrogenase/D-chiro-inositol 1-dehydrogenase
MNFALVGDDAAAVPLLEAIVAAEHRVIRAALAVPAAGEIASHEQWSSVSRCSWEELLIDEAVEAIVVAGDSDDVQTAAKQLASAGKRLLIVPRVAFGSACAYELSLIRDDSHVELMPAFALRFAPELVSLSQRIAAGELGAIRRLQVDRELPSASSASALTDAEIESAALDDIDLLHWLGGRYDQVTAQRSGVSEQGCSQATLTLAGNNLPDATWTARRGSSDVWRLTVETDREPIVVSRPSTIPSAMIAAFVSSKPRHAPTWSDAVRAFDVLDAARRSLRRRRTIDLHFEILSERQQFKTQMTAIGCGMLMLTLFLMLALLGLGSLLESRDRAVRDAEAAGLLLKDADFESQAAVLTLMAEARLDRMAERLKDEPKSVYLEPSSDPPNADLDQHRRAKIVERLVNLGVEAADHRTVLAAAVSTGWETLMRVLRLAWIAPLLIFIVLQGLILVAKPTSPRKP